MHGNYLARPRFYGALLAAALLLSGCGLFGGSAEPAPTPTPESPRAVVPTFTPTPESAADAPAEPTATPTPQTITVDAAAAAAAPEDAAGEGSEEGAGEGAATEQAEEPTATPAPQPRLTVNQAQVNLRLGPGTGYGLAGVANQNDAYDVKGKSADGQWWLICCINGQEAWIFGQLASVENGDLAPVAEAPAAAQAAAQQPAAQAPAQPAPTATPEPAPPPAAAAADPCAGIGGDGCKFRLRAGPSLAPNGGGELKLQLHFIHSGIDGGQPQGSYFVWVEKDGQKLPISDGTRSIALNDQQGMLGKYNYEFKVGRDQIPGSNVAGTYAIWVLDGNGERDSQTFTFTVPDGQGEVWMQFDQG